MTNLVLTCNTCHADIAVPVEAVLLHVDTPWSASGELLFCCPTCGAADVERVVGGALAMLLLVGVSPLTLSQPTLDACDAPPAGPQFEWQDLLDWHQRLEQVETVEPWR